MIGALRGTLVERFDDGELVLDVGGVGYRVTVPASWPGAEPGSQVFLHVHTHVRDDAIVLFGFPEREQRRFFELLIGLPGVGPSLALAILSVHSPASLRRLALAEDLEALCLVPGVGRKTAARLLVELRSRFDADDLHVPSRPAGDPSVLAEVRQALGGLGYGPEEVRAALSCVPAEGPAEELLRAALRQLARTR